MQVEEKVHHLFFSVVAEDLDSLLGDKACVGLVKRVYCINTAASTPSDTIESITQNYEDV